MVILAKEIVHCNLLFLELCSEICARIARTRRSSLIACRAIRFASISVVGAERTSKLGWVFLKDSTLFMGGL